MKWFYFLALAAVLPTIIYTILTFIKVHKMGDKSGDLESEKAEEVAGLARAIRLGAWTFIRHQFKTIAVVVAVLAILFTFFIERSSGITFLIGALMSTTVCIWGMNSALYANVRTTNAAASKTKTIGRTTRVAIIGGSIPGLSVQAFGLLGMLVILLASFGSDPKAPTSGLLLSFGQGNLWVTRLTTYALGCSIVAMFNRVAGGIFTKSADIASDIIGKVRHGLVEDDRHIPTTLIDFIGDMVCDIAGNCSDLMESFVGSIVGVFSMTLFFLLLGRIEPGHLFNGMMIFPVSLAGVGLLSCLFNLWRASRREMSDDPSRELNHVTYSSAGMTVLASFFVALIIFGDKIAYSEFRLGWISPWLSSVLGIMSGVVMGMITERYTSSDFHHTRDLAKIAPEGEAFVVAKGESIGSRSVMLPMLVIALAIMLAGKIAGNYGIAIAAVGMLSFVGTTVSIDAFGPISDNAGGIAEFCELESEVRRITDKLDAFGNTTAAMGKAFAIGSAALASLSMIISYINACTTTNTTPNLNIATDVVIVGVILGAAVVELFVGILGNSTIDAAKFLAQAGEAEMDRVAAAEAAKAPAEERLPRYNYLVEIATKYALRKMIYPAMLAIIVPVFSGLLFGWQLVGGLLVGALAVGTPKALMTSNAGGAFDNAKKYIESGALIGHPKGSLAHKAAVIGDILGDILKDVIAVAIDILLKEMVTIAIIMAPLFISSLF